MTTHTRSLILAIAMTVIQPSGMLAAETRVAVIASRAADVEKLVPLVELRLAKNKEIALLEREKIEEILREQELGALLTAEGTAQRIALGKLLKADLLIVLQGEEGPPPQAGEKPQPHARVTICETKQGLRLCNQPVEFAKSIETDADAVLRLAEKAIEKLRKPIDDIVAVPPLVNNTLVFEGDRLKAASARLIEEMLLDRPGVLVVELAEARAIAQELAIGGTEGVQRRLPLYLMGEYRLEGQGEKQTVSFKLVLLRGSTQLTPARSRPPTWTGFPNACRRSPGRCSPRPWARPCGRPIRRRKPNSWPSGAALRAWGSGRRRWRSLKPPCS